MTNDFISNNIDQVMPLFAENAVFDHASEPDIHVSSSVVPDAIQTFFVGTLERVESVKGETLDRRIYGVRVTYG